MSTPTPPGAAGEQPTEQVAAQPPAVRPRRRRRWLIGGASALALLVVAGVAAALLIPDGGRGAGPGGRAGNSASVADLGGADLLAAVGPGGGRGHGGEGRGLGSDTLLVGTVATVGNGTVVVNRDSGGQMTVKTDNKTRVPGGNANLGNLTAGERVVVRVRGTGAAATAVSVATPRAHVSGTVIAITGDRATVIAADGLTVTVDISGLATKPAAGDLVTLTGTSADGGATLKAQTVRTLPKAA
ncbi:hypothetical protein [Pseudonocardia acidicola]|uniref:DUF5666 domain-containing protein n=1 Tax=Pseudonocardia acidicola TaxID=2724939 RepID=A0ABX1S8B4_9PSEU|nr:hypothetical protein [Pseudonocardia acidicola]NMH97127.1 hypothetical protein [Pseudonocardia acidicola]